MAKNKNKIQEMEDKHNNLALKMLAIFLVVFIIVLGIPSQSKAGFNALGVHAGGNIVTFVPGYPWTFGSYTGYCPSHVYILVKTPPLQIGLIQIILPPAIPRASYNYVTPGLAYIGAYYPFPLNAFLCPYELTAPLYYGSEFGTSAVPAP